MDTQTKPSPENLSHTPAPPVMHDLAQDASAAEADPIPPRVKKPSKYRYVWLAFIVALVISVVGVGAYIIDAESKNPPSQLNALLTPTPAPQEGLIPRVTVPISETATYEDTALHYAFRYPKSLTLANEKTSITLADPGARKIITMEVTDDQKKFIDPDNFASCSVVINEASSGNEKKCVTVDTAAIAFGPNIASHFVYIEVGESGGGYDIYQTTEPALQFTVTFASGKEDGEQIFKQLLPTFTFAASPSAKTATVSGSLQ
jgi:hypothetical protein